MHTQSQTSKVHGFMDGQSPTIPMPAVRFAAVSAIVLGALALFAPDAAAQLTFCGDSNIAGSQFVTYTQAILTVIMFGGLFLGTIAIVIGFASKSAPFISSDKADWIKKGLVFGWGLPIAVYALKIVGLILTLDVDCLFPV